MDINRRLKALRESNRMTLEQVAKCLKVTRQTVQKYESGVVVEIPSDRIEALAEVYGVSPGYIMGWEDLPQQNNGDVMALREQLRRQPGMRILFDASAKATEQDLLDAAALLDNYRKRREGDE